MFLKKNIILSYFLIGLSLITILTFASCKRVLSEGDTLHAELNQSTWSTGYSGSTGTLEVYIMGDGYEKINLDSIVMKGNNPTAASLKPESVAPQSDRIIASFSKSKVFSLLLNPTPGQTYTITVSFTMDGNSNKVEFQSRITVSEDGNNSSFTLELAPAEWNLNFVKSSGTVEAFIRGEGIEKIDLNSIKMKGDNSAILPLNAFTASYEGNHVRARFYKNQVLSLLVDPVQEKTYTVTVSFYMTDNNSQVIEVTAQVSITGDDEGEGNLPPLALELAPYEWNLNYVKSSGSVEAFISGEGYDKIDLNSILMKGDNPSALPLKASTASLNGDHVRARFPKNQVIGLLLNPSPGSKHIITVSFIDILSGASSEFKTEIIISNEN